MDYSEMSAALTKGQASDSLRLISLAHTYRVYMESSELRHQAYVRLFPKPSQRSITIRSSCTQKVHIKKALAIKEIL
jgi:hypothetical protein